MDTENILYNGQVSLKFNHKQHRYYVKIEGQSGRVFPSGVTSILKTLYDQSSLLDWYSSMTAKDMINSLFPKHTELWDKAFLAIYKDEAPVLPVTRDMNIAALSHQGVIDLYKKGLAAPYTRSKFGKDVGSQTHDAVDRYHKTGEIYIVPSGSDVNDAAAKQSLDHYLKWFLASGLEVVASEVMVYSVKHNYAGTLDRIYKRSDGKLVMGDFKTSNLSRNSPMGIRDQYWSQLGAYIVAYEEEYGVEFADAMIVNSPKKGSIKIGYASDMNVSVAELRKLWLDDLQAAKNHKQITKSLATLKSRTKED